ncbi:oxidoreductase [Francisella halioticida]|uniref:Oxidoreductase n=1 Tax=Francisella halioticida TaxID=549298 RepID=A0ABN5B1W3_9GAMM|nr:aldo/keto reductase [Francisella halioticida]ASG68562.1 oxidoreductase [Francisella halioticida]BCD91466.1 oxidoreductase [Francisella halioticida]
MDHADISGEYKCEKLFGDALQNHSHLLDKMQIVSKCGIKFECDSTPNNKVKHYNLSQASIVESAENSLRNLCTDYLDLLLVHRPSPLMNAEVIANSFKQLRKEGKVKEFGVSNFTPSQFNLLNSYIPLKTNQVEVSVLHTDTFYDGTLDQLQQRKIRPMAWSPLAGGKIFDPKTVKEKELVAFIQTLVTKYSVNSIDQIAMAWLLKHPANPQVIIGSQNISRLENTVKSQEIDLDVQDWFKILEISNGYEAP